MVRGGRAADRETRLRESAAVSHGQWLQVTGAGFELLGLGMVAWGISRTRMRFGLPSFVEQWWTAIKRSAYRLSRKKQKVVLGVASSTLPGLRGRAYGIVTQGPFTDDVDIEERIARLRQIVNQNAESVTRVNKRIDDEQADREEAEKRCGRECEELAARLEAAIRDLPVGGLRLEAWGVLALTLGVILNTWGNLLG